MCCEALGDCHGLLRGVVPATILARGSHNFAQGELVLKTIRHTAVALVAAAVVAGFGWSTVAARGAPESFADLADQLSPADVNISPT